MLHPIPPRERRDVFLRDLFTLLCMSCAHKTFTRLLAKRYCTEHETKIKPTHVCSLWKMSDQMRVAGSGQGTVRDIVTKEVIIY